MHRWFKFATSCLLIWLVAGCAVSPPAQPQKSYLDSAIWADKTADRVYGAALTALTQSSIPVFPAGVDKASGLIVTKPRVRVLESGSVKTRWHYTLHFLISETHDNKIMVSVSPVDVGYNGKTPGPEMYDMMQHFNSSVSNDVESFFNKIELVLGKPESYGEQKVLFPFGE